MISRLRCFRKCSTRVGILAAVLTVVGLVGSGAAAQASTNPGTTTVHFTVQMHRSAGGPLTRAGILSPADEVVLNYCNVQVNNPHNSTHVPENVNVTGEMTCSPYPVAQSDLSLQLYYNGESYAYDDSYLTDVYLNPVQAATACLNGTYYATIDFWIYFGPQWTPETWNGQVASPPVGITC